MGLVFNNGSTHVIYDPSTLIDVNLPFGFSFWMEAFAADSFGTILIGNNSGFSTYDTVGFDADGVTLRIASNSGSDTGGSGTTRGRPATPYIPKLATFSGAGYLDVYSASLNAVMPFDEGTMVWVGLPNTMTGTTQEFIFLIGRNISFNCFLLQKGATAHSIIFRRSDGVQFESPQADFLPKPGLNVISSSWSLSGSYVRMYFNGKLASETTTPGAHSPSAPTLSSNTAVIGARNASLSLPLTGRGAGLWLLDAPSDHNWHLQAAWRLGGIAAA